MFEWFNDAKRRKVHITGPMMSEQALHFAHDLGIPDFKASNGWRDAFKKRHILVFGKSCGEEFNGPKVDPKLHNQHLLGTQMGFLNNNKSNIVKMLIAIGI